MGARLPIYKFAGWAAMAAWDSIRRDPDLSASVSVSRPRTAKVVTTFAGNAPAPRRTRHRRGSVPGAGSPHQTEAEPRRCDRLIGQGRLTKSGLRPSPEPACKAQPLPALLCIWMG